MNVDEIADMVTECCDAPDATTCEEAGHLRNQAWLCRNNLVNGNAVAGTFALSFENASTTDISSSASENCSRDSIPQTR